MRNAVSAEQRVGGPQGLAPLAHCAGEALGGLEVRVEERQLADEMGHDAQLDVGLHGWSQQRPRS
jgi:hypothetical protein